MQDFKFWVVFVAAIIPMIMGMLWYSKALFGNAWMRASGTTEEKMKGANMALIFILAYVFSVLMAMGLMPIVIHQFGVFSVLANEPGVQDPNTEMGRYFADFMGKYGHNFRTFKHGALHGTLTGIFLALPIIGTISLFERKSFKYVAIHAGYWIVTMALVGGTICAFM